MTKYLRDLDLIFKKSFIKELQEGIKVLPEEVATDPEISLVFNDPVVGYMITPAIVYEALEELGYEHTDTMDNGWQHDTWAYFVHKKDPVNYPPVTVYYEGYTFELELYLTEEEE